MIVWREKLIAFSIHFCLTLILALGVAALIFMVWFPHPFPEMLGGWKLFALLIGCDLALGPLLSFAVYNSRKSRKELFFDYSIIAALQIAALVYGIYIASVARPVYIAFVTDRLEVATSNQIEKGDLMEASAEYRSLPLWGPELVATEVEPEDSNDALFRALEGVDVGSRPKFYVPYESRIEEIKRRAKPLSLLKPSNHVDQALLKQHLSSMDASPDSVLWLPLKHRTGFWTALIDARTGYPVRYLPVDPY